MKTLLSSLIIVLLTLTSGAQGIITTIAGGGWGVDGGLAINAALDKVNDVLVDSGGNVYIAEEMAIRRIDAQTQIISLYAGSYQWGLGCDGCPATTGKLSHANAIAFDKQWNLYIADWGSGRIRKVDAVTGIMTTYAGTGTLGYSGDGGPATSAQLRKPLDIAFDADDNLYIADRYYHIRRVDRQTGIITTIAGNGVLGSWNNGDDVSNVQIGGIGGICFDKQGNLYVADGDNRRIGKIDQQGTVTVYCGIGVFGQPSGDGALAVDAVTSASSKISIDNDGHLFLCDGYVRMINSSNGIIERVAGVWGVGYGGDGGPALHAQFNGPISTCLDKENNLYIADQNNYRVRKVSGFTAAVSVPKIQEFIVYPNPSQGPVHISSQKLIRRIEVCNLMGQTILNILVNDFKSKVDLRNEPDGVYLINIYGAEGKGTKRVVIHH